jgi:putative DNA primase/helicase
MLPRHDLQHDSPSLRDVVPPELKLREQWVLWRYELRDGKKTKVPYNTRTGRRASATDPETWCLFIEALEAWESGQYDGIGYVFSEEDPYAGLDLDKARDPETGAVAEWATEWVKAFGGYAEVSPSGTGLHIFIRGQAPNRKNQKAGTEAYSSERFFTVTGDKISRRHDIPERQDVLDRFCEKFFPTKRHVVRSPEPKAASERQPVDIDDRELLEKARGASKGVGERFTALYDRGDFLEHPSHSEARHELLRHLAFWTAWDAPRMSRIYESSALYTMPGYARKWSRLWERECERAIAAAPRGYGQEARSSKEAGGELGHIIEALRAQAASMAWEGRSGPTDRYIYGALMGLAARYGTIAKKGIIISADLRTLALEAGVGSLRTVRNSLLRLREERKLVRLSKKSTSKRATVYLLRYPESPQGCHKKPCVLYVPPLSKMRNPGPTTEKEFDKNGRKLSQGTQFLLRRLGKLVALFIERVASAGEGGITERELADELSRRPDNVRRVLVKALGAGLVIEGGDGRFRVPPDLEWRLQRELEESGCEEARAQDIKRYREERDAFYSRRDRLPDEAPSEEDMERERLQRVQDALDVLQDSGTGPGMILKSYLAGETKTFDYVVSAVAFYYGCSGAELWRGPVERAVELVRTAGTDNGGAP